MSREYVLHPFRSPLQLHINYAAELNEQQLAAVTAPPGPSLVLAGAGSGKTRTLIYRVAFLLEQGIPADRILLLTFTNKAAKEMMRRVADLLGQELEALWGGTFHSIGNRVLRQHAPRLGFQRDFSILDREDARHLITTCLAESGIDTKTTRFPKAEVLGEIFSFAINTGRPIDRVLDTAFPSFSELVSQISALREQYASRKRAANAMDFDDLLALWLNLMQQNEEVRELYQRRFQFILVDEYQDTNQLQSGLIDLVAARHHNVMVVGDDAQSIYAWRGANFQNIVQFPKRYPDAQVYKIETNYRSTPEILDLANAAIRANVLQFSKQLAPARKGGAKPVVVTCNDASEQAAFVAQRVLELREEGTDLNRMAVLYRSHFHALELQLELTLRNIPFTITSGVRFFEQAHVKDVTAYLKLVQNPRDELSFKRLAQLLPGVGGKGADKLWRAFLATGNCDGIAANPESLRPPAEAVSEPATVGAVTGATSSCATRLRACASALPRKATVSWAEFVTTIAQLEAPEVRSSASKMLRLVIEAGYEDYLEETYSNSKSRLEDLEQLAAFALQFPSVEEFLTQLALLTNLDSEEDHAVASDDEQLRLSSIHQAKGLEFDVVFVIMLCEGLFPSSRSLETEDGVEEERRLMYVAVTRARNELYLSYPLVRAAYGKGGDSLQHPSRFLKELPVELTEEWNLRPFE